MTDINKQKFLAELNKLLTFMYEEDRKTAIDLYGKLFDEAGDEHAVMHVLVSPLRQAVNISRTYDAKERKLHVHAQSRAEDEFAADAEETPAFVEAIKKLYINAPVQSAVEQTVEAEELEEAQEPEIIENQVSLFDEEQDEVGDEPEAVGDDAEEPVAEHVEEAAQAADEPVETQDVPEEQEALELGEEENFELAIPSEDEPQEMYEPQQAQYDTQMQDYQQDSEPEYKPRIFLLILYILLAIPLTLIAVLVLLIPTIITLALALTVSVAGVMLLVSAFSGFVVFADIIIVLGASLVILALGLLLLWLFIWFVGGAIAGLIRAVFSLGRKWCYKEVSAA